MRSTSSQENSFVEITVENICLYVHINRIKIPIYCISNKSRKYYKMTVMLQIWYKCNKCTVNVQMCSKCSKCSKCEKCLSTSCKYENVVYV